MIFVYLLFGLVFLFVGGDALTRGAVAIGRQFNLSELMIGVVIVGFGTSLPELGVCLEATLSGHSSIAVGNIIGSNISNVLLILAAAALVSPLQRPARLLVPDGYLLLSISAVIVLLGMQAQIPAWQGWVMIAALVVMLSAEYMRGRRSARARSTLTEEIPLPSQIPQRPLVSLLLVISGIAGVLYGADLLVAGATGLAQELGVSEGLIGLTIVAVGTSLPELASSITASWRGHAEVAYGNIIGSNFFNMLGVLGLSSAVGSVSFPTKILTIDGPVMIVATGLMLVLLSTGKGLSRPKATLMLVVYVLYIGLRFRVGAQT